MPYRMIKFLKDTQVHVYNRANAGNLLFRSPSDYEWFTKKINKVGLSETCLILAYCLMPTHFHFYLKMKADCELSGILQRLELAYAKYFNRKYYSHGHVFEGPFKSKPVTLEAQAIYLCKYIHLNPVKSNLVIRPQNWLYSNYRDIINGNVPDEIAAFYRISYMNISEYESFVNDGNVSYIKDIENFIFHKEKE